MHPPSIMPGESDMQMSSVHLEEPRMSLSGTDAGAEEICGTHQVHEGEKPSRIVAKTVHFGDPEYGTKRSLNDQELPSAKSCRREDSRGDGRGRKSKQEVKPADTVPVACPRCKSMSTKFCYYNNYNTTQPRYFCKDCQRYWTVGGSLRSVPPGSGRRKSRSVITKDACKKDSSSGTCCPTSSEPPVPSPIEPVSMRSNPLGSLLLGSLGFHQGMNQMAQTQYIAQVSDASMANSNQSNDSSGFTLPSVRPLQQAQQSSMAPLQWSDQYMCGMGIVPQHTNAYMQHVGMNAHYLMNRLQPMQHASSISTDATPNRQKSPQITSVIPAISPSQTAVPTSQSTHLATSGDPSDAQMVSAYQNLQQQQLSLMQAQQGAGTMRTSSSSVMCPTLQSGLDSQPQLSASTMQLLQAQSNQAALQHQYQYQFNSKTGLTNGLYPALDPVSHTHSGTAADIISEKKNDVQLRQDQTIQEVGSSVLLNVNDKHSLSTSAAAASSPSTSGKLGTQRAMTQTVSHSCNPATTTVTNTSHAGNSTQNYTSSFQRWDACGAQTDTGNSKLSAYSPIQQASQMMHSYVPRQDMCWNSHMAGQASCMDSIALAIVAGMGPGSQMMHANMGQSNHMMHTNPYMMTQPMNVHQLQTQQQQRHAQNPRDGNSPFPTM